MTKPRIRWNNLPVSDLQNDNQLKLEWDRLNAAHGDLPFLAADAIGSAQRILGNGNERLLVGYVGAAIVAMFILRRKGRFTWRTFQPSQLPLGAWVAAPNIALLDLARSLMRGPLGICLAISITQVDPRITRRTEDTADSQCTDYIDTGWIDMADTFNDYWAARGKNLRANMRKQRAKLEAEGVTLTMQVLHSHADMAPAIARYGEMESSGWKADEGTAIHPDNAQGRYYRELLEHASRRGEAAVYQFLFDERLVAMNLCLHRNGMLIVLKTTYDESIKGYSPAFLLREAELQEIHKEGQIKHLEYFGRLMDWHTKWTDNKRTIYHLTLYRWPFLKKLAEARHRKAKTKEKNTSDKGKHDHASDMV